MPPELLPWTGDIHRLASPPIVGVIVTTAAVVCGAMIGLERERAHKPAGIRTMILICLGSAIFTQASILLGAGGDRTRVAAQIVTGIGFLGAGAIMRERGTIVGITTGAGIWATAAVGMVFGGGYVVAGVVFTLLILATLGAARVCEQLFWGRCRIEMLEVTFDGRDGKTQLEIDGILDEFQIDSRPTYSTGPDGNQVAAMRYCSAHRHHRAFVSSFATLRNVIRIDRRPVA